MPRARARSSTSTARAKLSDDAPQGRDSHRARGVRPRLPPRVRPRPRRRTTRSGSASPALPTTRASPGSARRQSRRRARCGAAESVKPDRKPKADCFYVYPTVSDDDGRNSDLSIDPEERSIALYQAARYGLHCRIFAPMYRQITLEALFSGQPPTPKSGSSPTATSLAAWKTYLKKYNDGRGVILIGHSQGTFMLRQLITITSTRRRAFASGSSRRSCSAATSWSGRARPSAATSGASRPARRRSRPDARSRSRPSTHRCRRTPASDTRPRPSTAARRPGMRCCAATRRRWAVVRRSCAPSSRASRSRRGRRSGSATNAVGIPRPAVSTPWTQADAYTGACSSADNANVLQIAPVGGAPTLNAVPDATWGLHLTDANIALGNLTNLVKRQIKAYEKASAG